MQVDITGHHVNVTPALESYVQEKLKKMHTRFSNITHVHVTLTVESPILQKAEATVNIAKGKIYAEDTQEDMYAAIDGLIDKLDRQVVKHKEKLQDRGGNGHL